MAAALSCMKRTQREAGVMMRKMVRQATATFFQADETGEATKAKRGSHGCWARKEERTLEESACMRRDCGGQRGGR